MNPSTFSVIPTHILLNKNLEPMTRIFYAFLSSLSNQMGYCWASNEYFAELFEVDVRTIQRWLNSLKSEKIIKIESTKEGIKTQRKIWITPEFQKMFTKGHFCHPPHDIFVTPPTPRPYIYNNINTNRDMSQIATASAEAAAISSELLEAIKKTKPDIKEPNLKKWAKEIDDMLRIDGRNPENVRQILAWLPTSDFYKKVVLSPKTLRKNFDQMILNIQGEAEKRGIEENIKYAHAAKELNKQHLTHMRIFRDHVSNVLNGKDVSFKTEPKEFKKRLCEIFGATLDE